MEQGLYGVGIYKSPDGILRGINLKENKPYIVKSRYTKMFERLENMKYNYYKEMKELDENQIFVFGSNPCGIHGKGTAKLAIKYGAIYGEGRGLMDRCYAIPTKNIKTGCKEFYKGSIKIYNKIGEKSISPDEIRESIYDLYEFANENQDKEFVIAYRNENNNLNGYSSIEIIDMFTYFKVPDNVKFHESFKDYLENKIDFL